MKRLFAVIFMLTGLNACGAEDLERAEFNAFFYHPGDGKEERLGVVTGLGSCQRAAHDRAATLGISKTSGWSYVCCRRTSSSECATKHK